MPEKAITLIKGDKVSPNVDYRDQLPVNVSAVLREVMGSRGYMLQEPGLTAIGIGSGKDRGGIWNERRQVHFRVSGTNLISVAANGTTEVLGTIDGADPVSMPYSFNSQAIIGGGKMYLFEAGTVTEVTDPNLRRPVDAVWVDGYYFLTDGEYLYHTQLADESAIDPLDFATAEFSPDPTIGLGLTMDNKVIVFGRYTIEYFVNAAESEFAFTRLPTRAVKYGLVGTHAKCEIGGQFYFLGNPKESNVTVYALGVGSVEEIASREVAKLISQYSEKQLEDVVMEARVLDDYTYLILHLPDETLLFNQNIAAGVGKDFAWSILKSSTHLNRPYRAIHGVYDPRRSEWVYGDKLGSTIGFLDEETATHYGELVECIIYTPFVYLEHQSIDELEIFMIPGYYTPNWPFAARISGEPAWPGGPEGFSSVEADPSRAVGNGEDTIKIISTVRDTNDEPVLGLVEGDFEYIGIGNAEPENFADEGAGVYSQTFTNETSIELSVRVKVQSVPIGTVEVEFFQIGELFGWGSNPEPVFEGAGTFPVPKPMGEGDLWFALAASTSEASSTNGGSSGGNLLPRSGMLALKRDGSMHGVGYNFRGLLGLGDDLSRDELTQTGMDDSDWADIACGGFIDASSDHFALALKQNGSLYATGFNEDGQLGQGNTTSPSYSFLQISGTWDAIFAGARSAGGLIDGTAYVWGANNHGQLGLGDTSDKTTPTELSGGFSKIAFGAQDNSMSAIIRDGDVMTCGDGVGGQLGLGSTDDFATFQSVGLSNAIDVSVSVGDSDFLEPTHTIVVLEDGRLFGWGRNTDGQLGLGDTTDRDTPVQIGTDEDWIKAVAARSSTFALKSDGTLHWCGSLPGTSDSATTMQQFPYDNWIDIASGGVGVFGLKSEDDITGEGAFDLSNAASAGTLETPFSGVEPRDIKWLNDGNLFSFTTDDGVFVAGVNTPYDITTFTSVQSSYLGGNNPVVSFSPDGTIMLYGNDNDNIETHFLGTPWDVSSQFQMRSREFAGSDGYHAIDPNGRWMLAKHVTNVINQTYTYRLWELEIPWDVDSAVDSGEAYDVSALPGGDGDDIGGIAWASNGRKLYWVSNDTGVVRSASMAAAYNVNAATDDGVSLGFDSGSVVGVNQPLDQQRFYLAGAGKVEQFNE